MWFVYNKREAGSGPTGERDKDLCQRLVTWKINLNKLFALVDRLFLLINGKCLIL